MEKVIEVEESFAVQYEADRNGIRVTEVWLVNGDKEIEVTEYLGDETMTYFLERCEEEYQCDYDPREDEDYRKPHAAFSSHENHMRLAKAFQQAALKQAENQRGQR